MSSKKLVRMRSSVPDLIAVLIIAALIAVAFVMVPGCRSRSQWTLERKLKDGEIQTLTYAQDEGFHFFSDGEGKTLSPQANINIGF